MTTHTTHTAAPSGWIESVYERLAADDDGRVCKAIADEACREVPGNFLRMLLATGVFGALAATWSVAGTVLLLGLAGLAGAWMSLRWQEVSGQAGVRDAATAATMAPSEASACHTPDPARTKSCLFRNTPSHMTAYNNTIGGPHE